MEPRSLKYKWSSIDQKPPGPKMKSKTGRNRSMKW